MDKRSWAMLRVLINRYDLKSSNALLKFLPQEEIQAAMAIEINSTDLTPILKQPQNSVEKIHYSWIKPLLEKYPEPLRPSILSALTPEQMTGLQFATPVPLSQPVRIFILNQLYRLLKINEHIPEEYLPKRELSLLTKWTKQEMMSLMDFLGLYDLASEVRHIVNRNYLKNIYACLTPKQFHFLKVCLHQKEQIISPKLGIDPSKQDCSKLKQILHKRGLVRLSRALCGQHPDLVWHIAHTLDSGRGNLLLKEYQSEPLPKVTPILQQQVLNLINFLNKE